MRLSLNEAATALGKTPRQVRYLIKQGQLPAKKTGGQWRIESEDLPLSAAQRRALASRVDAIGQAMADAVTVVGTTSRKAGKRYSVRDLRAFRIGATIYRELVAGLGTDDAAARHLHDALDLICRGCHTYRKRAKLDLFKTARERAASAITDLLPDDAADEDRRAALADRIEQELLPDLAGLIRTTERRAQRERLDPFDAFASVPA